MATVEPTEQNSDDIATRRGIPLVDFRAGWYGPCRLLAPVHERVAQNRPDIAPGKIDIEAERRPASDFGISSIPTPTRVRDGTALHARPGALPEAAPEDAVRRIRAVDIDEVRRKVAAEAA
ncbi:thioredoxin domain-containing protein [Kitasatospora sp. NPDC093679]|uniref:thioredoxin domain-containing protein n=1 Tax=Kitasatospora sp. NPDC093679 TaxID=3154983 RepID=UPI0034127B90